MQLKEFIGVLEKERISEAIALAEKRTSGEIRVFVSRKVEDDPVSAAQREFARLGMAKTKLRNAVLLFVAPKSQTFAIVGDQGVHEKCGQSFWGEVAEAMRTHFLAGHHTDAIIHGIHEAGDLLAKHFPHHPDDIDELPNTVE